IYRNVRLVAVNPIAHIGHWGSFITTPDVNSASATVNIVTNLQTSIITEKNISIVTEVYDAKNKFVASKKLQLTLDAEVSGNTVSIAIKNPQLWSVDRPYLYKAVIKVLNQGKV